MLKTLAGCIREYKKDSIKTPFFVTFEVILEVLITTYMANLIDNGIGAGDMNYILKIGLMLASFAVFSLIFGALASRSCAIASTGFAKNLRHDMYHNIQNFAFSNMDKFKTSSIITRLTTDVTNVQMAYMMIVRTGFRAPAMIIFCIIMSVRINFMMSLIFLITVPILGTGLYLIMKYAHPMFEKVFRAYDRLNAVVQENLHGIRVVKSFVREEHEVKKFGKISNIIYKDFSKAEKITVMNAPLMQFCVYSCMLLIAWFGAKFIVASGNNPAVGMSTGQLISLITYTMQILMSLMMLSFTFVMAIIARNSAERIAELINEKNDISNCENPIYEIKDGSIKFENVNFSYSKLKNNFCLKDINIDIKSGETVGIIGGTGSAKSTLVQLIPRLYDTSEGTVYVGGEDVKKYDIESLRNCVAMVLQKNVLFSGTIKENLRWGNENATDEELINACKLACADEFIKDMPKAYDTYIEQGGTNVSGGQRQRLCIARALLKKPKILILDDSTSAVDTKTDASIRKAFKEQIPNTTKIIIAQRIASVEDADKIIIMDNGKVNDIGTHSELIERNAIYREVYYSQMKGDSKNA